MEMILPNILNRQKVKVVQTVSQYSEICHFSKYFRLALTDFRKTRYFIGDVFAIGYGSAKF